MSGPLNPRLIEREIARIREKESNPYSLGTKTNLFTLLVFRCEGAAAPGAADHVEAPLQYLLGKRPARIITIRRTRAERTEAWVSGRCFPDKRNRGVCFEEVRIDSGNDGVGADPGAWAPLVIRDLPVFAWMPDGVPSGAADPWETTLRDAAGLIDKLLVDSSRSPSGTENGAEALAALLRFKETMAETLLFADFSWIRGRVLREQTARVFDPAEMRPLLSSLQGARLYGGTPAEAWLFFTWLGSRLGRTLRTEHVVHGALSEGFKVTFLLDGAPAVEIGCTRGGCLSRGEEKAGYRFPSDGEILLEEVDSLTRDPVFHEVITHARRTDE
ncbi:MAG: glucose-6-phosphate dehydrogenase assembly protein OpcA [Spirochaetia bacterium]|jgi:hypothetical protein